MPMKALTKYIVITCLFLNSTVAFSAVNLSTSDNNNISENVNTLDEGKVILEILEDEEDLTEYTLGEKLEILYKAGEEFSKVIEGEKIDENFTDELAQYFPKDTTPDLYEKQKKVKTFVRLYRYFKDIYEKVKAKMLVPDEPPLIVEDSEYDMGYGEEYIEAPEGYFVVVEDFKKVLSYGSDPRDKISYEAKMLRDLEQKKNKSRFEELFNTMSKVNWKKALFDDDYDYSPFTGTLGSGDWVEKDGKIRVRILTDKSKIGETAMQNMIFSFAVADNYFIKASSLGNNNDIKVDFSKSVYVLSPKIYYPAFNKLDFDNNRRQFLYGGVFPIPFTVATQDIAQDMRVIAKVEVTLCNLNFDCEQVVLEPSILLESGEGLPSQYAVYVRKSFANLPRPQTEKLKFLSLDVETDKKGQENLRIIFANDGRITAADVFVESGDNIEFERPRISIDNERVTARLSPVDESTKLKGKTFTVTAIIDNLYPIRDSLSADESGFFSFIKEKLSLSLILLAILGGFILNLMPCVFPVLSLKLMSLNKMGARKSEEVKKSFQLTIGGIFSSFLLLALLLCLIKYLGYGIGWGMQFQNPVFLVCMTFMMTVFVAYVLGIINFKTPKWINKVLFKSRDETSILYFLTGVLVVLMATPCTAPYLGTVIGFALAGSYVDIVIILMSVALGLSLPYFFFAVFPHLAVYVPKPGSWMEKINIIMILMLILTLLWLVSIYYAQTDLWAAVRLLIYAIVLLLVLWFRHLLIDEVETTVAVKEERKSLVSIFNKSALLLVILLFAVVLYDAIYNFNEKRAEVMQTRTDKIDMSLIESYVKEGRVVIVYVQADWCLTCKLNDVVTFKSDYLNRVIEKEEVVIINVDWTNYDKQVLEFMEKYGRKGLPFTIIYSRLVPDGIVLPEILNDVDLIRIINNNNLRQD